MRRYWKLSVLLPSSKQNTKLMQKQKRQCYQDRLGATNANLYENNTVVNIYSYIKKFGKLRNWNGENTCAFKRF